ncbi:MAG: DUF5615 family PIN-like protein [Dehalococcoidia bacterium]
MPVGIYMDADSCSRRLVAALLRAGFDVALGKIEVEDGASDEVQMARAIELKRVIVTANSVDFARIHKDLAERDVEHPGIVTWARTPPRSEEAVAEAIIKALLERSREVLRNSIHYL